MPQDMADLCEQLRLSVKQVDSKADLWKDKLRI
jgi:hypothetical protein